MNRSAASPRAPALRLRPRIGFLGVGWIGRHRMEAVLRTGQVEAVGIADPSAEMRRAALDLAPKALSGTAIDDLLTLDLDGIVIATPSAAHAEQSIRALDAGVAVFCQKPLGRNAAEAEAVVAAARRANRLLGVDFSYRFTAAMTAIAQSIREGALGRIHAIDLVFHNGYGPDKPWFYDRHLSGGGCVMDLGVHLVDLALWAMRFPEITSTTAELRSSGHMLGPDDVEDFAVATLVLDDGVIVRLACSWRLPAGQDAVIEASFYGSEGGAALRNVAGSFYDFTAERFHGTSREPLAVPPDEWGGRAAANWARRLAAGERFDPAAVNLIAVSRALDGIYAAALRSSERS